MDDLWLIWTDKHGSWWRPERAGYTRKIDEAGRYTRAEAELLCDSWSPPGEAKTMLRAPEANDE